MRDNEKAIAVAAEMYAARRQARNLLGAKYKVAMDDWGKLIKACAEQHAVNDLKAAQMLIASAIEHDQGVMVVVMILASYVEMVEPSA